ncbi:MAG: leucine-rich repeat domain-containing protein [Clostridia bacterium]|nr:leucine-rich repeat domain-containing protein [Clostridia bacterium]
MKSKYYMSAVLCTVLLLTGILLSSCGCKHENAEYLNAAEATCQTEGYTGDRFCNECKEIVSVGEVIPILEHEVKTVDQIEATCQNDGYTGDDICVLCNELLAQGVITAALPHEWLPVRNEVEATHLSAGYTGDSTCKNCQTLQNGQSIPMLGHTFVDHYCNECGWDEPGLYLYLSEDGRSYKTWTFTLSWQELKDNGYVTVKDGDLVSVQGNFQEGLLVIGEDVTSIGKSGINNNTIDRVYIPRTVTELPSLMLFGNESVRYVRIYAPLQTLGDQVFYEAKALDSIDLPNTLTYIGDMCFQGCENLYSITIPDRVTEIGSHAFNGSGITKIKLPEGLKTIQHNVFKNAKLEKVVLPSSLENCNRQAFYGCADLQSVDFSSCENLTVLESGLFDMCTSLQSVKLPPNLIKIESYCFSSTAMVGIDLPDGINEIDKNAFWNSSVKQAVIPKSLITLGGLAECDLRVIRYKGSEALWKMSTGAEIFKNAEIEYDYTPNPGLVMTGGTLLSDAVHEEIPSFILEAVCAYYDLLDTKEITEEMLDGITSLRIMYDCRTLKDANLVKVEYEPEDYYYHIYASVNQTPFGYWGPYIRKNRYENLYMKNLQDEDWTREKLNSYYTAIYPDDIYLDVQKVQELLKQYPSATEYGGYYVCDPDIKARELREVRSIIVIYGFMDNLRLVSEREIDLSSLKYFQNITEVEYCMDDSIEGASAEELAEYKYEYGLTFKNSPVKVIETYKSFTDFYE